MELLIKRSDGGTIEFSDVRCVVGHHGEMLVIHHPEDHLRAEFFGDVLSKENTHDGID